MWLRSINLLILLLSFSILAASAKDYEAVACLEGNCLDKLYILSTDLKKEFPQDEPTLNFELELSDLRNSQNFLESYSAVLFIDSLDLNKIISSTIVRLPKKQLNSKQKFSIQFPTSSISLYKFFLVIKKPDGSFLNVYRFDIKTSGSFKQRTLNNENLANLENTWANACNSDSLSDCDLNSLIFTKLLLEPSKINQKQTQIIRELDGTYRIKIPLMSNKINRSYTANRNSDISINTSNKNYFSDLFLGSESDISRFSFSSGLLKIDASNASRAAFTIDSKNRLGLGISSEPTASLDIQAGNEFPAIRIRSNPLIKNPVDGSLEFHDDKLYFTANGVREILVKSPNGQAGSVIINNGSSSNSSTAITEIIHNSTLSTSTIDFTKDISYLKGNINANTNYSFTGLTEGHKLSLSLNATGGPFNLSFPSYVIFKTGYPHLSHQRKMIRFEVIDASPGSEVVLAEAYDIGNPIFNYNLAHNIFGLRRINPAYVGSACRIRRASDNGLQDINFGASGGLDVSSVYSFCWGTNCFVHTWYDQSGNANNATQSNPSNQPKIYDSVTGVIVNSNGLPALRADGVDDSLDADFSALDSSSYTIFAVEERASNKIWNYYLGASKLSNPSDYSFFIGYPNPSSNYVCGHSDPITISLSGQNYAASQLKLWTNSFNLSTGKSIYLNGALQIQDSVLTPMADVGIGHILKVVDSFPSFYDGYFSELMIFPSDLTSNRSVLESSIKSYYGIF